MSKDRFSELNSVQSDSTEMQQLLGSQNDFATICQTIQTNTDQIVINTASLKDLHRRALVQIQQDQQSALNAQLDSLVDSTGSLIANTKNLLLQLDSTSSGPAQIDRQTKYIKQQSLLRKFMDVTREYQSAQSFAKKEYRSQLERQVRIAKPNATNDEINEIVDSGNAAVFQQFLDSNVAVKREILDSCANRQHRLEKLNKSLLELLEIMEQIQMMLQQQQTFVDDIETNIDNAANDLERGNKDLGNAVLSSRSLRQKKWIIFGIVLVVLIIAAIVIATQVTRTASAAKAASRS